MFVSLVVGVYTFFFLASGQGPQLPDLLAIECTEKGPYFCRPYGLCCRGDQFCLEGECLSCFPSDVPEEKLLDWCRDFGQSVELMRHWSCRLACFFKFNALDVLQSKGCRDDASKCPSGQKCHDDQYCNGTACVSCFPSNMSELQQISLCREILHSNTSSLEHKSCVPSACYARFSPTQLAHIQDKLDHWMVAFFVVCTTFALYVLFDANCSKFKSLKQKYCNSASQKNNKQSDRTYVSAPSLESLPLNKTLEHSLSREDKNIDQLERQPISGIAT
ncbi:cytochrome P450 2 subfamily U member 1 [Biomphalaria glabrata]|nr:hypothetical protein BgiMline_025778 [Biomphalaria glabrata]